MRRNFLMLLVSLAAICVNAAEWVKPTAPQLSPASAFVPSEDFSTTVPTYYLWNEQCQAFFGEGNDWNIRASLVKEKGLKMFFSKYKINGEWQEGNYLFNDYTVANQAGRWDWVWIHPGDGERPGRVDTDYKEPGQNREYGDASPVWNFEVSEPYIRIYAAPLQPIWNEEAQGKRLYIGQPAGVGEDDTKLYATCVAGDNIEWRVVTEENYQAYATKVATYNAAMALEEAIEVSKAKHEGINLSEVEAVLNNLNSTEAELKAALARIPELEKEYAASGIGSASVANPFDATDFITNPNYDGDSRNGWTGIGGMGNSVAEVWNTTSNPMDITQTITGLPNGVYQIQVHSLHRAGNDTEPWYATGVLDDNHQYLRTSQVYANGYWKLNNDITCEMRTEPCDQGWDWDSRHYGDYYFPNGLSYVAVAFNDLGQYDNSLFCTVSDGTLKIGVRCLDRLPYSWTSVDAWRLTYYGASADATDLLKSELKENIKDYSDQLVYSGYKEQLAEALKTMDEATDYAVIEQAYATAMSLFYDMEKSRMAYNAYVALAEEIMPQTEELDCEDNDKLIDYLSGEDEGTFGYIIANTPLTNEELTAQMEWMKNQLDLAIKNSDTSGFKDFTSLIPNHDMTQADFAQAGWTVNYQGNGSLKGNKDHLDRLASQYHIGEVWQFTEFDLNYTLTDMPQGIYELELPAVYRNGNRDFSKNPVEIYINNLACNVKTVLDDAVSEADAISTEENPGQGYDTPEQWGDANCFNKYTIQDGNEGWPNDWMFDIDGTTYYTPGSCDGAAVAFWAGRYINKVYGIVGEDGVLKLGLRTKSKVDFYDQWVAMGRMKLTYMGEAQEGVDGLKGEVDATAEVYLESEEHFSQEYKDQIESVLLGVQKATTLDDINSALENLAALYGNIETSKKLYDEITRLITADNVGLYAVAAANEDMEGMERAEAYMEGMEYGKYNNEEAQAIIDAINTDPLTDVIYIRGGLLGYEGDDWETLDFPMRRNAEGKYVGTASFRDERYGNVHNYAGSRSLVRFHRLGQNIASGDNQTRFLNENPGERKLAYGTSDFQCWGGEWEFTIDLDAMTMTSKCLDGMRYKSQIYAVGNLRDNHWARDESTANHWDILHQGNGIYQGSVAFNDGVERGEVTLFMSEMWKTDNWDEGRIGNPQDLLEVESGEVTLANRFQGDRKWILDPSHRYLVTYDLNNGTVKFDIHDLQGDDTEESPLLVSSYEDLLMVRSYLRQGETHYFALTQNINMTGKGWSQLNGPGAQNGAENQRWINFDGRNFCIIGFGGDTGVQSRYNSSFFGTLGGVVKNLGFVDANVVEDEFKMYGYGVDHAQNLSIVAGVLGSGANNNGTKMEQCFVTGTINGGQLSAGALAGTVNGKTQILNCYAQVDVNGTAEDVAGLVGRVNSELTLQNAYFVGAVSSEAPVVGAFSTTAPAATIANVANWTSYKFDTARATDAVSNILNFDGSNAADLKAGVVAFDNTVWSCGTNDEYPILSAFRSTLDGVSSVVIPVANEKIYTITGQRVNKAEKGVYIINGKKILK